MTLKGKHRTIVKQQTRGATGQTGTGEGLAGRLLLLQKITDLNSGDEKLGKKRGNY